MKRANPLWYYAALLFALVPVGIRMLTFGTPPAHALDAAAVEAGKTLFTHDWKPNDPLAKGGDGLGPVFNATSCVACHGEPSLGGGSGLGHNVTMFTMVPTIPGGQTRQGVVHARATEPRYLETLNKVHGDLPQTSRPTFTRMRGSTPERPMFGFEFTIPASVIISQRNTPALYGAKWIDEIPDRVIVAEEKKQQMRWGFVPSDREEYPVGRALRLPDGRVGKFGWKAQSASLLEFVQAACANELGLGNPAQAQPGPIGRPYVAPGLDLTAEQCEQMTAFIAALPRPVERLPENAKARAEVEGGDKLFTLLGCAHCHAPSLGSIEGIYSDMLLHRMGLDLQGGGFYYGDPLPITSTARAMPSADEWRTPPLWGVADSAPYLHDGRAATLEEAIALHGGQGANSAQAFRRLLPAQQAQVVAFLKTLRAP